MLCCKGAQGRALLVFEHRVDHAHQALPQDQILQFLGAAPCGPRQLRLPVLVQGNP